MRARRPFFGGRSRPSLASKKRKTVVRPVRKKSDRSAPRRLLIETTENARKALQIVTVGTHTSGMAETKRQLLMGDLTEFLIEVEMPHGTPISKRRAAEINRRALRIIQLSQ